MHNYLTLYKIVSSDSNCAANGFNQKRALSKVTGCKREIASHNNHLSEIISEKQLPIVLEILNPNL